MNYPVDEVLYPRRTEKEVSRKTTNTINTLPDDVLLAIFDHYRSALGAHSSWCQIWYTLAHVCRRWKELVLTSSRRLDVHLRCTFGTHAEDLLAYSPPLPLVLDYRYRSPRRQPNAEKWTYADMDGAVVALQHLHRAREIALSAPACTLATLIIAMAADGTAPAPILERLELESQSTEPVLLPSRLLDGRAPPRLRRLLLSGCALPAPALRPFLSSATSLVRLALHRIPVSVVAAAAPAAGSQFEIPDDDLASCVRAMPRLRSLSVSFVVSVSVSATPRSSGPPVVDRLCSPDQHHQTTAGTTPIRTSDTEERAELPALEELAYQGPSTYIDTFLAEFRAAPRLRRLRLKLFDKPTVSIPHVAEFIHSYAHAHAHARAGAGTTRPPKPALSLALVEFYESSASLTLFPPASPCDRTVRRHDRSADYHDDDHDDDDAADTDASGSTQSEISIRVLCERLDDQLSALASICGALARDSLSPVTELMLGFYNAYELPPPPADSTQHQQQDVTQALWRALLAPFRGVRALRIDAALGAQAEIARALAPGVEQEQGGEEGCDSDSDRPMLLPALCAVEPLYQVAASEPRVHGALLELAERNRRFAAARPVVGSQ